MYGELFKAVAQSATVLTGSGRLARSLTGLYSEFQRDQGRAVWKTPRILQWDAWLLECWQRSLLQGSGGSAVLLNPVQEASAWEAIITESPAGRTLLRIPETAARARDAWALVQAYRLPFEESAFSASEDCEAFFGWAREFQSRCHAHGWIEPARLSGFIRDLILTNRMGPPAPLFLAGFDELTPQQKDLLEAIPDAVEWRPRELATHPSTRAFQDTGGEIQHAALWALKKLEDNPAARIGIAVPNIATLRSKLERGFTAVLEGAFHLSLGPALSARPVVRAALLLLELAATPLPVECAGMFLRSRFSKGAEQEQTRRAALDASLRRTVDSHATIADLRGLAGACPILHKTLGALERELPKLPTEQTPSAWSPAFSRLLQTSGWPGDRPLNSEEHQTVEGWNGLLSTFASLDLVTGRMAFGAALGILLRLAANKTFQPENEGAPVQILGLLEASGLRFDHLWVLGLHDEEMPPAAQPNPFLPLSLQVEQDLPHCSANRELDFNRKLLARLAGSAPEVILSFPRWEGDQQRGRSPLVEPESPGSAGLDQRALWVDLISASAALETFVDPAGLPLSAGSHQPGGTYVLKDMAACAFRAYAQHRLGARELEASSLGIDAREKGSAVHRALEFLWAELKTQANLRALPPAELQQLIDASIAAALGDSPGLGRVLERRRLQTLLTAWMEIERARLPFRVLESEAKKSVTVGGLEISTRIDRVDELPDGRRVIIDYKTGLVKAGFWSGDRPDEPQVPLYCATTFEPIAGAAFAQLRAGDMNLRGVSDHGEFGSMKDMKFGKEVRLPELIADWRRILEQIGSKFRAGIAEVDPKCKATCQYCQLTALCRVRESSEPGEDSDE